MAEDRQIANSLIGSQLNTYQALIAMGFNNTDSISAAQTFGSNVEGATNYLITTQNNNNSNASIPNEPKPVESKSSDNQQHGECPMYDITHFPKTLMSGYIGRQQLNNDIPDDIHKIIIKYFNFLFIKLRYDIDDETDKYNDLMSFDKNITFRSLALSIEEKENYEFVKDNTDKSLPWYTDNYPTYIRFWVRFFLLKPIYPINKRVKVTMDEIERENNNQKRWVEIPCDYDKKFIHRFIEEIDDKQYILELVIEKYDQYNKIWSFQANNKQISDEWRKQLKIGDFVDVMDEQNHWYESVIRYMEYNKDSDDVFVYIHYIGWNIKWDEKLNINDVRIGRRGCHTRSGYKNKLSSGFHSSLFWKN